MDDCAHTVDLRCFFAEISANLGALDSNRSRNDRTLDPRRGREAGCRTGKLAEEMSSVGNSTNLRDPESDEVFVLLDLKDETSEVGDDAPEEISDRIEGFSGLRVDSVIQWCSSSGDWRPFQRWVEVN